MAYENHIWGLTEGCKDGHKLLVSINGKSLQMELDTEVTVSVISEQEWKSLFNDTRLLKSTTVWILKAPARHNRLSYCASNL